MAKVMEMKVDAVSYRKQVETYANLAGIGMRDAMREGASVMAGQLARRFPPKSAKHGRNAIENDLSKIIRTDMNEGLLNDLADRTNDMRFDPHGVGIQDFHEKHRTAARKRTRSIRSKSLVGGAMFSDRLVTTQRALNQYKKRQSEGVGRMKARWTAGAVQWKGSAKLPAWITKHADKGRVVDAMKPNGDGYIELINTTPYASQWKDIADFVTKSQGRMFKNRISGELKKQNAKFNRSKSR